MYYACITLDPMYVRASIFAAGPSAKRAVHPARLLHAELLGDQRQRPPRADRRPGLRPAGCRCREPAGRRRGPVAREVDWDFSGESSN